MTRLQTVAPTALLALVMGLFPGRVVASGETPERLSVLFLGDDGHHRPIDRASQLIPVLAGRGIDITYTEDLNDLNPETLARYDALIVYANIDAIAPDQERALLDYVAGGGGFVPIHCASFCFRNSPAYVALVGAQFLKHGAGEFDTRKVDPDHPILSGFEPFRTWDETYVHHHHNPTNRHVLQTRVEGDHEEPWTWVRTHGKGRVFYTAYGHDARTWGHPGFHDLIERGIRWAANRGEVFDSRPRLPDGPEPFTYVEAEDDIPNYLPGRDWGTQGESSRRMQAPLDPETSMSRMVVPPGFQVELFAAEPDIVKPIAMAWDHRGRLWVAESVDYPNHLHVDRPGNDRITICEDTTGDGRADRFTVFADGLSIPTSLTFARGGVIVAQAPDLLFLQDTTGDDHADVREVLFSGWGTFDTHAGPSNLRWGFDNEIWGIVGYSGFQGRVGDEDLEFRQGFFRFPPDGSRLEFLRSTNNNSWGLGFSEEGLVFGSTANNGPSVYLPIPNRYYEQVRGWSSSVLQNIAASNRFFPITDKVRQMDWHGGFTAATGHALYTARTYPQPYWNQTAFVAEPTGHLVATFVLQRDGADVRAYNSWNLLASDDEWTAPIAAEVGPDGNVWVIDWYNFIIQHNPTPQGFETGPGNAYVTTLRDRTHGRSYRIVPQDAEPSEIPALDPDDPEQLVETLNHDNMFWRMHAQRLLVERGRRDVVPELIALVQDRSTDALGLNPGAIHALWTLHGLGALDGPDPETLSAAVTALEHPSAGVRRNALLVLPRDQRSVDRILAAGSLRDEDAQVRLATLLALAEAPPSQAAASTIVEALTDPDTAILSDRWLSDAATVAASTHDQAFLRALAARRFDTEQSIGERLPLLSARVAEHFARGAPTDAVGPLISALGEADPRLAAAIIEGLARGWPDDRPADLDPDEALALRPLLAALPLEAQSQLVRLADLWNRAELSDLADEVAASLLALVRHDARTDATRIDAARQLVELRTTDTATARTLLDLITPRASPELATGLIEAIGLGASRDTGTILAERLPEFTPAVRSAAIRVLLSRNDWTGALLDGLDQGRLRPTDLAIHQRQALTAHPDPAIAERAQTLLEQGGGLPDPDRQKIIDAWAPLVLRGGDAGRGQRVFEEQCAQCHRHGDLGGTIGPDLTGMAAHPKSELLVHILDPSRSVEGNFLQYAVATVDGRVLQGLLASETRTAIELLDAEGETHLVLRDDIEELIASDKSIMPEGFETQMTPDDMADLLEFLTDRGQFLPLDLRPVATTVSTRGMFQDANEQAECLIFPDWSPQTFEGVPFHLVDPQGDRVPNVILLHGPRGTFPPQMPKSVSLPCRTPARAIHFLSGVSGWGYAGGEVTPTVSLIVRLHYDDGQVEDHPLKNGVHFADYIRPVEVPASKLAFQLQGRQLRYLAVYPERDATIDRIELAKGPDATAPIVMAVTVEVRP